MISPDRVPPVAPDELLARFLFSDRLIRRSDGTIKPEAFVPHPHTDLSVTRHRDATVNEIWAAGRAIAEFQDRTLHGRGDVSAAAFVGVGLEVHADPVIGKAPLPDNPNHATVTGWPREDKGRQKLLALEISAKARLSRPPNE